MWVFWNPGDMNRITQYFEERLGKPFAEYATERLRLSGECRSERHTPAPLLHLFKTSSVAHQSAPPVGPTTLPHYNAQPQPRRYWRWRRPLDAARSLSSSSGAGRPWWCQRSGRTWCAGAPDDSTRAG